jgi:hypothetical protein
MQRHGRNLVVWAASRVLACAWLVAVGTATLVAQGPDPFVGTWELNAAKSSFGVPAMAYKGSTLKIEAAGNGQKVVVENIGPQGQSFGYDFTAGYDGKDSAVPGVGTVTLKRVDARTLERTHKTDGKPTMTFMTRVSPDGKTLTINQDGTGPNGQVMKNTLVYEKK